MGFQYDPGRGLLMTALVRKNTVIPCVLAHGEFWFFLVLHIFIKACFVCGMMSSANEEGTFWHMSWKNVNVITAITTFFAVFYSNQSYARYLDLYTATRHSLGNIYNFAFLIKLTFQHCNPQHMRLAFRFFASSVFMALQDAKHQGKVGSETSGRRGMPDEVEHILIRNRFLTTVELRHLNELPSEDRSLRLQQWATEVLALAVDEHQNLPRPKDEPKGKGQQLRPLPMGNATQFFKLIVQARENNDNMQDMLNMPVPFQYFHILNLMIIVNIALWSYRMALNYSIIAIFVFILAMVIFMGMLELAIQLSCPFGDDDVDFPLDEWISDCFRRASSYMENRSPGALDRWSEALQCQGPLFFSSASQSEGSPAAPVSPPYAALMSSGSGPLSDDSLRGGGAAGDGGKYSPFFGYMPLAVGADGNDMTAREASLPVMQIESLDSSKKWRDYHKTIAAQSTVSP